jgi:hypothetical protein
MDLARISIITQVNQFVAAVAGTSHTNNRDNLIIYIVLWGLALSSAAVTWWAIVTDASWLAWACGVPVVMFLGLTIWFSVAPPEYETPLYLFDGGSRCIMIRNGPTG